MTVMESMAEFWDTLCRCFEKLYNSVYKGQKTDSVSARACVILSHFFLFCLHKKVVIYENSSCLFY